MKVAIGIATAGRRDTLTETVRFITSRQSIAADEFLISAPDSNDISLDAIHRFAPHAHIIQGLRGLTKQRNAMMDAAKADILVFFDDDFLPCFDYIEQTAKLFNENPSIVVATGTVLSDGITGPGLDFADGVSVVDGSGTAPHEELLEPVFNGYGCNMAVRMSAVREYCVRFDEKLPAYGWLEDVDFSRMLAPYGSIVRSRMLRGAHLGTKKSGRSPGKKLGYSQIANPVYLARKGTLPWRRATAQMSRNLMANFGKLLNPEPWVDRRGRLAGNAIAMVDVVRGKLEPEKINDL